MLKRPTVLLALIAPWPMVFAQDAAPTARVQRDAENPLRVILEAARLKPRKAGEATKPAAKPERVQVRARAAAEPASAPVATRTADPAPAVASVSQPSQPAVVPQAAAPAPVPVPAPDAQPVVAAMRAAPTLPETGPAPAPPAELPLLPPLRVAQMVEPVLPRRIAERLRGGDVEVVVAFTVQADGSVRDPAIQSSSNPIVNAHVLQAVAQWRYGPVAAVREHTVQLLLRNEP